MVSAHRRQPLITITSVEAALDSLLYTTTDTSAASSLHYLAVIDRFLENPAHPPAESLRHYALRCILSEIITAELARQRQIFGLQPPEMDTPLKAAQQELITDSQQNSPELMAWSSLYFRYVRVELNLTQEEIGTLTSVNPRTLLRYKKHGIERLMDLLIAAEWEVRSQQRQRRLFANLPVYRAASLIGREAELAQLRHILETNARPNIFISGQSGVGKSALLQQLVSELIRTDEIDDIIWLENPTSIEAIERELEYRLLPPRSRTTTVRDMLLTWRVIVVLDDITGLANTAPVEDWEKLCDLLSFTTTFITSKIFRATRPDVFHLPLANLSFEDATLFLRQLFNHQERDETALQDYAAAIWHAAGGNPQGIHLAFAQIERGNLDFYEQIVLDDLYTGIYERLNADARQLWHIFSLLPEGSLSAHQIQALSAENGLAVLLAAGMVEVSANTPRRYGMNHPARQFVQRGYQQRQDIQMAFQQLIAESILMPVWLIECLLAVDWLKIEEKICSDLLHHTWREGVKNGHPVHWRHILEKHRSLINTPLRLAYAICLRRAGDVAASERYLNDCLAESGKEGDFLLQAEIMVEIAVLLRQRGEYEKAQHLLQRAAIQSRANPKLQQRIALELTQIAVDSGDARLAQQYLHHLPEDATTRLLYAEVYLLNRKFDDCWKLALIIVDNPAEPIQQQASAHTILGRCYQAQNRIEQAIAHFDAARILFERVGDGFAAARAQSNLAAMLLTLQRLDDAEKLLLQARSLQSQLHDVVGYNATQSNFNVLTRQRLFTSTHEETAE